MKYLNTPINNERKGEAIIIAKLTGQILSCNKEALKLYGYSSITAMKKLILSDLMPDDFTPLFPKVMTPEHLNTNSYETHVGKRINGELFACKIHTHYQSINNTRYLIGHVKAIMDDVDIEKLCLQQNIMVLKRELEAERNKNAIRSQLETNQRLSHCYPSLSSNDIKICYFLMLDYGTKQIAKELNITDDGVYAARKRIRKKLNLDQKDDLVKVLLKCIRCC